MRRNNITGKLVFALIVIVAAVAAFFISMFIRKVVPLNLDNFKGLVFGAVFMLLAGPSVVIAGKKIGGRR